MIEKTYQPSAIEGRIYAMWEEAGAFRAGRPERKSAEPYCIVIPPPNVTGSLHMGHALNNTLQDVLARFARMRGRDVLWQPGTDHAGIATQMVVERQLMERQQPGRRALGREKFLEKVWAWKAESGGAILTQLKRLGASCDWSRERFTMDEGLSRAVLKVFVELYRAGLIYKDKRLVNWDPKLLTAISDLEVQQVEIKGHLWHFKYPIEDSDELITIATTRPETMLGDTAVAVHPDDPRYRHLVGRHAILPLVGRRIPIVADEHSDPAKGTGAVKITPGHDFNDFEVGRRHRLPMINVLDMEGKLNLKRNEDFLRDVPASSELEQTLGYHGLDRFAARKEIVARMDASGLLAKAEPHAHTVPHGDRSGVVIEPYLTDQWYVDAATLAQPAMAAVREGRTTFVPRNWEATYFAWMENIQPWCISRQLWWGHQIPAWYGPKKNGSALEWGERETFVAQSETEAIEAAGRYYGRNIRIVAGEAEASQAWAGAGVPAASAPAAIPIWRDPDVLDTWFSSALWPFSTLGWPEPTTELARYYPTDVLVTGFDIIFFWVARMMMMGLHFMGEVPFDTVYIHALVRDERGAKMSKSKGNVIDPLALIEEYGADALRLTLAAMAAQGRDIKLSAQRVEGYRNFATKLWNACRFAQMNDCVLVAGFEPGSARETLNRWIAHEAAKAAREITEGIEAYRFNDAANAAYRFVWNVFCDWYLELAKPVLQGADGEAKDETRAMTAWARDEILKLLHPFAPFVTEELWGLTSSSAETARGGHATARGSTLLALAPWPDNFRLDDHDAQAEIGFLIGLIDVIRSARTEFDIPPKDTVLVRAQGYAPASRALIDKYAGEIERIARAHIDIVSASAVEPGDAAVPKHVIVQPQKQVLIEHATLPFREGLLLLHGVDVARQKDKYGKEISRIDADIARIDAKLANVEFVRRAPEEVVEEEREKRVAAATRRAKINEALERLKGAA
jgi:valyl-tRNA synthetase